MLLDRRRKAAIDILYCCTSLQWLVVAAARDVLDAVVPARELALTGLAVALAPPTAFSISSFESDSGNNFDRFDGGSEFFCLNCVTIDVKSLSTLSLTMPGLFSYTESLYVGSNMIAAQWYQINFERHLFVTLFDNSLQS